MDLRAAAQLAEELIHLHLNSQFKLVEFQDTAFRIRKYGFWKFEWNRRKKAFGSCWHSRQTIYLSAPLTAQRTEERVRNTILHEIAHAMAGPNESHGRAWKLIARRIGADPVACGSLHDEGIKPPLTRGVWVGTCPGGHEHVKYRQPKVTHTCASCAPRFDLRFKIEWTRV